MKKIWQQKKKKEKHDNNDNWKKRLLQVGPTFTNFTGKEQYF